MSESEIEYRISAGAIVIRRGRILLVRHGAAYHGKDFLVAPGGGVEGGESIYDAAIRETKEETGLDVRPLKILFVDDMISPKKRVLKIWFLCEPIGGRLAKTLTAVEEGIVEAGWFREGELAAEKVYPEILVETDWGLFFEDDWETRYLKSTHGISDF